ncbi:hypothetical protein, conserved [Babesia ovata]|uniref:Uncharacterized protein n=1 Tax=Babesia ovata TaxID=189622 RepID=A0A2H6K6U0_9APIC|nr:uncharacterized protein BOVATA_002100 [Babesia ovata]GBE58717.1 hypothetical protein, conserved [Babesia ovata]
MKISQDDIHIMRNRFGVPCGRVMVLVESLLQPNFDFSEGRSTPGDTSALAHETSADTGSQSEPTQASSPSFLTKGAQKALLESLPEQSRAYICDEHDVKCYVEQCERYLTLSEDLRRFADPTNLHRIVTVTGMNKTYGRLELAEVIERHTNVKVNPLNIAFRFKSNGEQDSTAWVLCDSTRDANRIIAKLQEVAVPKRYQYGALMGASFLYAARSSLFLSDPGLDFVTKKSKYQVFTLGWQPDIDEEELTHLANSLKFFPKSVKVVRLPGSDGTKEEVGAFFECDRMRNTKKLMVRLHMLKRRWKIPEHSPFYAYPKTADVRWASDNGVYAEDDPADDSDLDEPVHY